MGIRTDIISHSPKSIGMQMLIRSMGIEVIATDEIGTKEDMKAIEYAIVSGVSLLFTIHGKDINDLKRKENISKLVENNSFENIIILSNRKGVGTIEKIYNLESKLEVKI